MTVSTLILYNKLRSEVARMGDDPEEVDGVTVTTEFLCEFGRQGRNARFWLKFDGVVVGFKETYTPWSVFKDSHDLYILDIPMRREVKPCVESPYCDTPTWCPCADSVPAIVSRYKSLTK